jgi:hypothetical protein
LEKHSGSKVIAGARKPTENKELVALQKAHPNLTLVVLDVDKTASVNVFFSHLSRSPP